MDQSDQYIFAMETQRTVLTQLIIRIASSITKKIIVIPPEMIPNLTMSIKNIAMTMMIITMITKNITTSTKMKNMMICLSAWRTVASKKLILVHRKAHVHGFTPNHQNTHTKSCFNDCSPGIMYHMKHMVEQLCNVTEETEETEEEQNPFECAMDCPIEGLDPHSAESFCPWFSQTKNSSCFYDCSDDFLNMAQAHAEHTCAEFEVEGAAKFTSYINEPLVDELVAAEEHKSCGAGFYQIADYECSACADGMTSFPGAMSPEECFKRH